MGTKMLLTKSISPYKSTWSILPNSIQTLWCLKPFSSTRTAKLKEYNALLACSGLGLLNLGCIWTFLKMQLLVNITGGSEYMTTAVFRKETFVRLIAWCYRTKLNAFKEGGLKEGNDAWDAQYALRDLCVDLNYRKRVNGISHESIVSLRNITNVKREEGYMVLRYLESCLDCHFVSTFIMFARTFRKILHYFIFKSSRLRRTRLCIREITQQLVNEESTESGKEFRDHEGSP